jgi:hypothetical protein
VALALEAIVAPISPPLAPELLSLAQAESSIVRFALVRSLDFKPHPAHLPVLLALIDDHWTKRSAYGDEEEDYPIARTALSVIAKSGELSPEAADSLFRTAVNSLDRTLRRNIFELLVRRGEAPMQRRLIGLAIDPTRTRAALGAAGTLCMKAGQVDAVLLEVVTPHIVRTHDTLTALFVFVLLTRWGKLEQVVAVSQAVAADERRQVFLIAAIEVMLARDPEHAARIAAMLPVNHRAVAWVLAQTPGKIHGGLLHDLGDHASVNGVMLFLSLERSTRCRNIL